MAAAPSGTAQIANLLSLPLRRGGVEMLPLSRWHVMFGWLDLVSDILNIVSTFKIAQDARPRCAASADPRAFFLGCAITLTVLFVGNQVSQMALACRAAVGRGGGPRAVLAAAARGFFNLELAYHEFTRKEDPEECAHATAASLHHKMMELLWEAPHVVVSLTVLAANLVLHQGNLPPAKVMGRFAVSAPLVQMVSAMIGLATLSLGALDFLRLHPMSFWAFAERDAPATLFLGIVDVSRATWLRSLVIGAYAAASVTTRAAFFTSMLMIFTVSLQNRQFMALSGPVPIAIPIAMFLFCILLLIQLKLRGCSLGSGVGGPTATWLYASALSTFINIPWVTAPATEVGFLDRWSCWPSWVMSFLFGLSTAPLAFVFSSTGDFDVCAGKDSFISLATLLYPSNDTFPWWGWCSLSVPLVELALFLVMTSWLTNKRRRALAACARPYGGPASIPRSAIPTIAAEMGVPMSVPALSYHFDWKTLCMVKATPSQGPLSTPLPRAQAQAHKAQPV
jgi:hypothetical protein